MAEITLVGTCETHVVVDTDSGEVTKVVVLDEAEVLDRKMLSSLETENEDELAKAYEIARATPWPAWQFGY